MTEAKLAPPLWPRRLWLKMVCLLFSLQVALIFLLEKHPLPFPHKTVHEPLLRLQESFSLESLPIRDPTLFVLPHHHGFSGQAWLNQLPTPDFQPADWTEPARELALNPKELGNQFPELMSANAATQFETLPTFAPTRNVAPFFPLPSPATNSSPRPGGPLANRLLFNPPQLLARVSADPLTNSVVQVLVDAKGRVCSAVLLSTGSVLTNQQAADANALEMARTMRFGPVAAGSLTVGTVTFEWQTLPPP